MKYEVNNPFRDKDSLEVFGKGDFYETKSKKRASFLQEAGFLGDLVKEEKPKKSHEETAKGSEE